MAGEHGLTKAQIRALRYFAPGCKRERSIYGEGPTGKTLYRLEQMGLTAWRARHGNTGADETTDTGLAILVEIDRKAEARAKRSRVEQSHLDTDNSD